MKKAAVYFENGTFCYDQVDRCRNVAIYRQRHKHSNIMRYEVVLLALQRAHTWPNGTTMPEPEAYPPASAWGKRGWTFHALPEAQGHCQALLTQQDLQCPQIFDAE